MIRVKPSQRLFFRQRASSSSRPAGTSLCRNACAHTSNHNPHAPGISSLPSGTQVDVISSVSRSGNDVTSVGVPETPFADLLRCAAEHFDAAAVAIQLMTRGPAALLDTS